MRIVDISVSIENGVASDPAFSRPKVTYFAHDETIGRMRNFFPDLQQTDLPDGKAWAMESVELTTHNGTHLDAPYHFHPTMNHSLVAGGERASTIDEIPLDWCFRPGVKLDLRHLDDGYVATADDVRRELDRIEYELMPYDIVVVNTRAGGRYGEPDYVESGCGVGRDATLLLLKAGVRITGTDAWSWDAPFSFTSKRVAKTGNMGLIWEGHKAGRDVGYCHMEKLHGLEALPPHGFRIACFAKRLRVGRERWPSSTNDWSSRGTERNQNNTSTTEGRMRKMNRRLLSAAVAGALIALGLGAQSSIASAKDTVPIGVIFPTKSIIGQQGVQGANIAADMLNADGGVNGKDVRLIVYDTNYSPVEGVAAVERLLTQDGVRIVAGEISSTIALAAIPVVQAEDGLLMLSVPKHPDVTKSGYDRVFRLNTTSTMDAVSFNAYLKDKVAPQKIAYLAENNDFGRLTLDDAKKSFGSKIIFTDIFEVKQSDFSALASNVRGSGADLVCIMASNPEQSGNLIKSMADVGYKPKRCLTPGVLNNDLPKVAGAAAEGVFSEDIYAPSIDTDLNRQFVKSYEAKYKSTPGKIELLGFESVWIAGQAMQKAGTTTDTKKIAETLRANPWSSPRGMVTFDSTGQASSDHVYFVEVKDGKVVATQR
jgi:branched-chain amino acid transport system substrate-binding protein